MPDVHWNGTMAYGMAFTGLGILLLVLSVRAARDEHRLEAFQEAGDDVGVRPWWKMRWVDMQLSTVLLFYRGAGLMILLGGLIGLAVGLSKG
jgi:hypothetical protein